MLEGWNEVEILFRSCHLFIIHCQPGSFTDNGPRFLTFPTALFLHNFFTNKRWPWKTNRSLPVYFGRDVVNEKATDDPRKGRDGAIAISFPRHGPIRDEKKVRSQVEKENSSQRGRIETISTPSFPICHWIFFTVDFPWEDKVCSTIARPLLFSWRYE